MPHNMIILYVHSPYFHVSNSALFFNSAPLLSFYIDVIYLDTFCGKISFEPTDSNGPENYKLALIVSFPVYAILLNV